MPRFQKHLFICNNKRSKDDPRGSCSERGSDDILDYAKKRIRELGLKGKISVSTEDAYDMVETLEKKEGILAGQSSAAALCGTLELARRIKKGVIVTVFPDSCDRCYVNFGKFKEYYEQNQSHKLPKADG